MAPNITFCKHTINVVVVLACEVLDQFQEYNTIDVCIEILVDYCNEKDYDNSLESNVPLSVLERRSELEVRATKCGDVRVSPSVASGQSPPPTASLVAAVADMLHNASALAHAPVPAWNEQGLYRLLFRCASMSKGSKEDVNLVRCAASRALVAATPHKCVRTTLASTKDCLHNLLITLKPLQEDEIDNKCIPARTQALLLLASLLAERAAGDSVWTDLKHRHMTAFFCFLLLGLDTDEKDLQAATLYCLTQLSQSMVHKKHSDKSRDDSRAQFFDNIKSAGTTEGTDRFCAGDSARDDCHPEYMAEDLCRVLMGMYRKISLEDKKYQCSQDDAWSRVCACLSSLLAASARARSFGVHRGLPALLLASFQAVRDHLSVLGKPIDTIKNANHNPTLRTLYWLLTVINSSMVECPAAKESFAENGIAVSLNRLWPWCMMTEQLRLAVATLLFNFTNDSPKAWSAMCTCVGGRNLVSEVCALGAREAALASRARADALLLLCVRTLTHCAPHHQCRALMLKNDIISSLYKATLRSGSRGGGWGAAWARLCGCAARHADGAQALLALRPLAALAPTLRLLLLPALAHAAHHHRVTFLQSPDLLELLSGTLLTGDTIEMISAARAVWALAANNHKAKLLLRSAGVAAAVHSALQRVQRARSDAAAQRAAQLLAYTHAVLQAA